MLKLPVARIVGKIVNLEREVLSIVNVGEFYLQETGTFGGSWHENLAGFGLRVRTARTTCLSVSENCPLSDNYSINSTGHRRVY